MMTDPIADMLTRIRNAGLARHDRCELPASRLKTAVAKVLKDEGYIADFRQSTGRAPRSSPSCSSTAATAPAPSTASVA
jgi:small subunit ribosomal protein S8